jgi:hypothetical protein
VLLETVIHPACETILVFIATSVNLTDVVEKQRVLQQGVEVLNQMRSHHLLNLGVPNTRVKLIELVAHGLQIEVIAMQHRVLDAIDDAEQLGEAEVPVNSCHTHTTP